MTAAHLHLALNHAPLFGILFAVLGLTWALARKDEGIARASLGLLVLAGLLVLPVYLSGENAEDIVEDQVGVSHDAIEAHEDAALGAAVAVGLLGLVALGLLIGFRRGALPRSATATALMLALAAGGWIGYVANLGGQINHPEIREDTSASAVGVPRGASEGERYDGG
ncbi:MAG: hypothetical protein ABJF88_08710 [Rhodothermales bacterium]